MVLHSHSGVTLLIPVRQNHYDCVIVVVALSDQFLMAEQLQVDGLTSIEGCYFRSGTVWPVLHGVTVVVVLSDWYLMELL